MEYNIFRLIFLIFERHSTVKKKYFVKKINSNLWDLTQNEFFKFYKSTQFYDLNVN
jgi:hypothetical protein